MAIAITVRFDRVGAVIGAITANAPRIVAETAAELAQRTEAMSPRRTGSLAASWYVSGPGAQSNYGEKRQVASDLNPAAVIVGEITPQDADTTSGPLHPVAVISAAVQHDLYVELGTRYMAPRPIMIPAAEATHSPFITAMRHVADL